MNLRLTSIGLTIFLYLTSRLCGAQTFPTSPFTSQWPDPPTWKLWAWHDAYDYHWGNTALGAMVVPDRTVARDGDEVAVRLILLPQSTLRIFNSRFNSLLRQPAALMVFDEDHRAICDMLDRDHGSSIAPSEGSFSNVGDGMVIGGTYTLDVHRFLDLHRRSKPFTTIYLQLIAYKGMLSFDKFVTNDTSDDEFMKIHTAMMDLDRTEIFRSPAVKIDLFPKPTTAPSTER